MKMTILRECMRIARKKLPHHPEFLCYPHFAFIIQDNKLVEWAYNTTTDNPPVHFGYKTRFYDGRMTKNHAEFNAFRKAKGIINPARSFECINIHLKKSGRIGMSAPCVCCYGFLQEIGCAACYYTTDNGAWGYFNLTRKLESVL